MPPEIIYIGLDDVTLNPYQDTIIQFETQIFDENGVKYLNHTYFQILDPHNQILISKEMALINSSAQNAYYLGTFIFDNQTLPGHYKVLVVTEDTSNSNISAKAFEVKSLDVSSSNSSSSNEVNKVYYTQFTNNSVSNVSYQNSYVYESIIQINKTVMNIENKITILSLMVAITLLDSIFSITAKIKMRFNKKKPKK